MKEIDITSRVSFEACAAACKKIREMIVTAYDRRDEEIHRHAQVGDFVGVHEAADRFNAEISSLDSDLSIIDRVFETNPRSTDNLWAVLTGAVIPEYTITEAELDRVCELVKQYT